MNELNFDEMPELTCPYCGEPADVDVDPGGSDDEVFQQDCSVCCRPWQVHVHWDEEGAQTITLAREDD